MITTHLMGGTGNSMFQYAIGRATALKFNTALRLNVSSFVSDPMRDYTLGLFKGVSAPTCHDYTDEIIREQGMPYNQKVVDSFSENCSLYGYWQTERYISSIRYILLNEFVPKTPLPPLSQTMERYIQAEGLRSVFLTIRRTDYVGNNFHGLLPIDYYLRAAKIVAAQVVDPCFFIFSDDPNWCLTEFKSKFPYRSIVAGNFDRTVKGHLGREDAELHLMKQCRHAIMANSSYSWWGSYLGTESERIVIAPKQWFGPASKEDARDIVPERWLRL